MSSRMLRSLLSGPEATEALVSQPGFPLILAACEAALPNRPATIRYIMERLISNETIKQKMSPADVERIERCLQYLAPYGRGAPEVKPSTGPSHFVSSLSRYESLERGEISLGGLALGIGLGTNAVLSTTRLASCAAGVTTVYSFYFVRHPDQKQQNILHTSNANRTILFFRCQTSLIGQSPRFQSFSRGILWMNGRKLTPPLD